MNALLAPAVASLLCLAAPLAAGAAPAPGGRVVGKLLFRDRDRVVTPAEAERILRGRKITLALRRGWDVVPARLAGDGRFEADVAPGAWRLEWIGVGDRAEVLGQPLAIEAAAGAAACAGTIQVAYADLASELSASAAGAVTVAAGCEGGATGAAGPAPELHVPRIGFPELAEGLRAEGYFVEQEPRVRLTLAFPLRRPLAHRGGLALLVGAARGFGGGGAEPTIQLGAALAPWHGVELSGGVGGRDPAPIHLVPWAGLRLGPAAYGFDVRADARGTWSFGLDLSLFHLAGRMF